MNVSVIIPTYNRITVLPRALDSVLAQSVHAAEICVVDDGSDDGTADKLARDYPMVTCVVQDNHGVSHARNTGLANTSSDWVAFLDSDDEWLPQKLERQLSALKQSPNSTLVHSDEIWIRNGRRVNPMVKHKKAGGEIFLHCLPLCAISPSSVLMSRNLLNEMGGFDESLPACEDYDLWLKVCSRYPVLFVEECLLKKYGGHDDQLSKKHWGMDRFRVQALENLLATMQLTESQFQATLDILKTKCEILLAGAKKRENTTVVEYYQQKLEVVSAFQFDQMQVV